MSVSVAYLVSDLTTLFCVNEGGSEAAEDNINIKIALNKVWGVDWNLLKAGTNGGPLWER